MSPFDPDEFQNTLVSARKPDNTPAQPDKLGHYLVAVAGTDPGRIDEITSAPITMGRDPKQTIVFADTELSRAHVRFWLENGSAVVEDLRSTNGTFVDGRRIVDCTPLSEGALVRAGQQILKYERRTREEVTRALELRRDLERAQQYVLSQLPPPIHGRVSATWHFVPSSQLGGDSFGYDWIDGDTFVFYLIDVSGHGVGAAMHSVAVMNVLRQRALPDVDFADPGAVLSNLNERFQMDTHDGMYFTIWYGVYRGEARRLRFSAAGHHAAYLVSGGDAPVPIGVPDLMIGAVPAVTYATSETTVPPDSTVYLFSDGVFEIVTKEEQPWRLGDFVRLLAADNVGKKRPTPAALYDSVKARLKHGAFDDDFSLVSIMFA